MPKKLQTRVLSFLSGNRFFYLVLALFVVQAAWLAVSVVYPMAYDEQAHLETINYFSYHPNPFINYQPAGLDIFWPLARDPSYLFKLVMALPWRLIGQVTDNYNIQIVMLRLINVGLFAGGLVLFRRLLQKATDNNLLINIAVFLVVLTPISTQLAAQINYDNLFIPLVAGSFLLAVGVMEKLKKRIVDLWQLGWLLSLLFITSLVKYTFLPMLVVISLYLFLVALSAYRTRSIELKGSLRNGFKVIGRAKLIIVSIAVVISFGLFVERHGINVIRYHDLAPACNQILDESVCLKSSLYQRGLIYKQTKLAVIDANPALFTYRWLKHMHYNLMFALNGPTSGYVIGRPMPLPYIAGIAFCAGGLVLSLIYLRRLFSNLTLRLLGLVSVVYLASLWMTNYASYLNTGRRVAVQGRYLVPFLPFFYLLFLLAYRQLLIKWPKLQAGLATVLVLCFMAGGGAATLVLHSDSNWYWSNSTIVNMNNTAKQTLRYITPHWNIDYVPYWQNSRRF